VVIGIERGRGNKNRGMHDNERKRVGGEKSGGEGKGELTEQHKGQRFTCVAQVGTSTQLDRVADAVATFVRRQQ
jgi:hypothetical protein